MKAIIISAGSAIRLGYHTKELPKGLLKIKGKTMLERQISIFEKQGIKNITIITGPHNEKFNLNNVTCVHDSNYSKHDVLGSFMISRHLLNDDVIVSYADIIFDENVLKTILDYKCDLGIAVDLNWEQAYEGRTEHPKEEADNVLINNGKIMQIKKNITSVKKNEFLGEFIGIMKLTKKGCSVLVEKYDQLEKTHVGKFHEAPSLQKAYLTDMLQELIDSKINVVPIIISGKWYEIDTPQDLKKVRNVFN